MIFVSGRSGGGGFFNQIGCMIFGVLLMVAAFYILRGLYNLLWWASPALLILALIINWRVVAATGERLLSLLRRNPVGGLVMGALGVVFFPVLTLFWFLSALGAKRVERFQREFQHQWGEDRMGGGFSGSQPEPDFAEYEEIESTPATPVSPPEISVKEAPKPQPNPYDQLFDGDGKR